jgi:chitinase
MALISISNASIIEGPAATSPGKLRFIVKLSAVAAQEVTVEYITSDLTDPKKRTASDPLDYISSSGTVKFSVGQTEAYIDVDVPGDLELEPDEFFNIELLNPVGADLDTKKYTAIGTITDKSPKLSVVSASTLEGPLGTDGTMRFIIKLSAPAVNPVQVDFALEDGALTPATQGIDYLADSGTLYFDVGQLEQYLDVKIHGDAENETDEILNFVLSNAVGASLGTAGEIPLVIKGTIKDDETAKDAASVKLTVSPAKFREGDGDGYIRFTVLLSSPVPEEVTVNYKTEKSKAVNAAKAGTDFYAESGIITFRAGETAQYIDVRVFDDRLPEAEEIFDLLLFKPKYAGFSTADTLVATGTISDNEPTISAAAASGNEGADSLRFAVTLSAPTKNAVSIQYTSKGSKVGNKAKAGSDYVATKNTLTFAPGETTKYIEVNLIDDYIKESDEIFELELSNPREASLGGLKKITLVGTIMDNEPIILA